LVRIIIQKGKVTTTLIGPVEGPCGKVKKALGKILELIKPQFNPPITNP